VQIHEIAQHVNGRNLPLAARQHLVIPTGADQHLWAQSRIPMDMIFQGWSVSLVQASQQ